MAEECSSKSTCGRSSCEGCPSKNGGIPKEPVNAYSRIQRVIGIVSGKGGVGKSTVTTLLARELAKKGCKVGIMDADITGPSIPRMLGVEGQVYATEQGDMIPLESAEGIKTISMNLLLDTEEDPVVWRGPVIAGVVKQFWTQVCWGELDYLLVDMPPGTGDVPLTIFQSLPVDGIVIVTSPQELVRMIVMKAYNMADKMNIPVLGFVENYSYFQCTDCGTILKIFGESGIDTLAAELNTEILAKLPILPQIAGCADIGAAADLRGVSINLAPLENLGEKNA